MIYLAYTLEKDIYAEAEMINEGTEPIQLPTTIQQYHNISTEEIARLLDDPNPTRPLQQITFSDTDEDLIDQFYREITTDGNNEQTPEFTEDMEIELSIIADEMLKEQAIKKQQSSLQPITELLEEENKIETEVLQDNVNTMTTTEIEMEIERTLQARELYEMEIEMQQGLIEEEEEKALHKRIQQTLGQQEEDMTDTELEQIMHLALLQE